MIKVILIIIAAQYNGGAEIETIEFTNLKECRAAISNINLQIREDKGMAKVLLSCVETTYKGK